MRISKGLFVCFAFAFLFNQPYFSAADMELPAKGKETKIKCLEFPAITYNVLIPEDYDPSKTYPIIYTFSPGGGGMVNQNKSANEVAPSIIIGVLGAKNNTPEMVIDGEVYAVMWDSLARFNNIDPTAQYAAGFSGGSVAGYKLVRRYRTRIGGVMASGGWLQNMYDPWYVYPKGLCVARTNGENDGGANSYCDNDMAHLKKAGCSVKDWKQPGGHSMATPERVKDMMQWLISNKPSDKTSEKAPAIAAKWKENPYSPAAIKEIFEAIKDSPRTKLCNLAMLEIFDMMKDDEKFSKITIPTLQKPSELAAFFGYVAYGSALNGDSKRFSSAVFALDKICQDKTSKWGGIIAALYIFTPIAGDTGLKTGLEFIKKYTKGKNVPTYNQLVLAVALLKNGMKSEAAKIADKITAAPDERDIKPVIENLKKAVKEGESALETKLWIDNF